MKNTCPVLGSQLDFLERREEIQEANILSGRSQVGFYLFYELRRRMELVATGLNSWVRREWWHNNLNGNGLLGTWSNKLRLIHYS